jgi:hypothetical protein
MTDVELRAEIEALRREIAAMRAERTATVKADEMKQETAARAGGKAGFRLEHRRRTPSGGNRRHRS